MKLTKYNITITAIIILILLSIAIVIFPGKTYKSNSFEILDQEILDELKDNDHLEQSFISDDNYNFVGIPIATYSKLIKKGKIIVTISNEKGKTKKYIINSDTLLDCKPYFFKYNLRKNKAYKINVIIDKLSSPITLQVTNAKIDDATLIINNEKSDKNITLYFLKAKKDYYAIWYCLLIISILSCYAIMIKENK